MGISGVGEQADVIEAIKNTYDTVHNIGDKLHFNIRLKEFALKCLDHYDAHKNERGSTRQMLGGVGLGLGGAAVAAGAVATVASGGIGAAILAPGLLIFGIGTLIAGVGTYKSHKNTGNANISGHQFAKDSFKKVCAGAAVGVLALFAKGKKEKWRTEVEAAKNLNNLKTLGTFFTVGAIKDTKIPDLQNIKTPKLNSFNISSANDLKNLNSQIITFCKEKIKEQIDSLPLTPNQKGQLKKFVDEAKDLHNLTKNVNKTIKKFSLQQASKPLNTIIKVLNNSTGEKLTHEAKKTLNEALNQLPEALKEQVKALIKNGDIKQLQALLALVNKDQIQNILSELKNLNSNWENISSELASIIPYLLNPKNTELENITKQLNTIIKVLNNNAGQSLSDDAKKKLNEALNQLPQVLKEQVKALIKNGDIKQLQTLVNVLAPETDSKIQKALNQLPQELQKQVIKLIKEENIERLQALDQIQNVIKILSEYKKLDEKLDNIPEDLEGAIREFLDDENFSSEKLQTILNILNTAQNGELSNKELKEAVKQLPKELQKQVIELINNNPENAITTLQTLIDVFEEEKDLSEQLNKALNQLPKELQKQVESLVQNRDIKQLQTLLNNPQNISLHKLQALLNNPQNISLHKINIQSLVENLPPEIQNLLPENVEINTINALNTQLKEGAIKFLTKESEGIAIQILQKANPKLAAYFLMVRDLIPYKDYIIDQITQKSKELYINLPNNEDIETLFKKFENFYNNFTKNIIERLTGNTQNTQPIDDIINKAFNQLKKDTKDYFQSMDWVSMLEGLNLGGLIQEAVQQTN